MVADKSLTMLVFVISLAISLGVSIYFVSTQWNHKPIRLALINFIFGQVIAVTLLIYAMVLALWYT